MEARSIIAKIRDGCGADPDELKWFADGLADGTVTDAQAGAFAMAVCLKGLGTEGRIALTTAMRDSGDVLTWDLPAPVIDKHSTGGVGDCVSLVLAPALAACGAYVPMVSGRGLGHTGGTLDKLESIPGYRSRQPVETLRRVVADVGCAIVGATGDIAPADRRLYAIRDVTGTVESIDLITSSILAKKLAAGLDALVLDVKTGNGAFLAGLERAVELAEALVSTASGVGTPTVAVVTDMNQPLAPSAGNALEVAEVCRLLTAEVPLTCPLGEVTLELGADLLVLAGLSATQEQAKLRLKNAIASGVAAEKFDAMVLALGGPPGFLSRWRRHLPSASVVAEVKADADGFLAEIDTRQLGETVVGLGGGRLRQDDVINHAVGLSHIARLGQQIAKGTPLAVIHAASDSDAQRARQQVLDAMHIAAEPSSLPPLIHRRLS